MALSVSKISHIYKGNLGEACYIILLLFSFVHLFVFNQTLLISTFFVIHFRLSILSSSNLFLSSLSNEDLIVLLFYF